MTASALNQKNIAFIGGGNMAGAIIDGLLKLKAAQNLSITILVSDADEAKQAAFNKKGVMAVAPSDAEQIIRPADVVVLAVKPQVMAAVAADIAPYLDNQLVLSIAAGLSVDKLISMLGGYTQIVRCMPNLPASVGAGASGLFADKHAVDDAACQMADSIMQASGITAWVDDEALLHAVTAVAGSAPAYFFYVLEHMTAKAVQMGLDKQTAHALAVQSLVGAGLLAKAGDPATLREQVTSKGGTTAAALDSLMADEVGVSFAKAMQACSDRSIELGKL